ncbi:uncharacterized protein LOC119076582 [Bradysia coprophila]|uniref:uncharacterized protein LOC119076582 n=1 Tax=Bradysia coprophila TaxID=38358 RepID=UPI00187DB552|nr:uncharacterized protein LOC119076582 [Bradysia coprophila]
MTNCSPAKSFDPHKREGQGNIRTTGAGNVNFFGSINRLNGLTNEQKKVAEVGQPQRPVPICRPKKGGSEIEKDCSDVAMKLLSQKKTEKWLRNLPLKDHILKQKPSAAGTEILRKNSKKVPFFENLKASNPKYSLTGDASATLRSRKSGTFIVDDDKLSVWTGGTGGRRLDFNEESDLKREDVGHDVKNRLSSTDCSDNLSQNHEFTRGDNGNTSLNDLKIDGDTDDIVIFERTDYSCPKVHQAEKAEKIPKSINIKKMLLIILGISFIISLVIWSIFRFNLEQIFLNYFNVHTKQQPTNYEVSLRFVKNVCRLIGLEY